MTIFNESPEPNSSILGLLDGVRMSEQDRDVARAYLRKTEAALDLIWLVSAGIAAVAGSPSARSAARVRLSTQKQIAVQLP